MCGLRVNNTYVNEVQKNMKIQKLRAKFLKDF